MRRSSLHPRSGIGKHRAHTVNFILVDGVAQTGVDLEINLSAHFLEDAGCFALKAMRDPWIDIAASDENGHSVEPTGVVAGCSRRADQRPAKDEQSSEFPGITDSIFNSQAGALRKAAEEDLPVRKTIFLCALYERIDQR